MRVIGLALLAALAASVAGTGRAETCRAPAGTEALLNRPGVRTIVVGEVHGTAETPAAFGELVCAAAAHGPVTVGIEWQGSRVDPVLAAWLASDGGADAKTALLALPDWRSAFTDGRFSAAMLALVERLRALRAGGADIAVVGVQPPDGAVDEPIARFERRMADTMAAALARRPKARLLVLVGILHARKSEVTVMEAPYAAATSLLPAAETLSLRAAPRSGTVWNCRRGQGCGPGLFGGLAEPPGTSGVVLRPEPEGSYDGVIMLGPATASPPAVGQLAEPDKERP